MRTFCTRMRRQTPNAYGRTARLACRSLILCAATTAALAMSSTSAHAQYHSETRAETAREETHAEGRRHVRDLDSSFSGQADVADALERLPEVRIRRSGSLNGPAYLSIRAAEPQSVAVFLEGIPLNGGNQSSVSLNMVLPELLQSVEVYRSNAPLALGSYLPGGAVNLRLRDSRAPGVSASIGGGSFGSGKLGVMGTHRGETSRTLIALAWRGSRGDFTFFNNNGTDFNTGDDNPRERRINNKSHEASLLFHHEERVGPWRLSVLSLTDVLDYGIPGLESAQASHAHGTRYTQIIGVNAERRGLQQGRLDLLLQSSMMARQRRYDDRAGEVGLGSQDRMVGEMQGTAALLASWWLPKNNVIRLRGHIVAEHYGPRDRIGRLNLEAARRVTPQLSIGWGWRTDNDLLALNADVRALGWFERTAGRATPALQLGASTEHLIAGQVGAVLQPIRGDVHGLTLFAYASRTGRAPDFDERFGDNGSSTGNPDLTPESQWQIEAGFAHEAEWDDVTVRYQAAGFRQWRENAIEYFSTPLGVAIPNNVLGARITGIEAMVSVDSPHVGGNLSLTHLRTKNLSTNAQIDGNALPWRSPWSVDGTLYVAFHGVRMAWQSGWDDRYYADARNRRSYPSRWLNDLSLRVRARAYDALEFTVEMRNVGNLRTAETTIRNGGRDVRVDRPIADYRGYPLPGRAVYGTVTWRGTARTTGDAR